MYAVNKHGLSRHIPEDVKRRVREMCGFGCVICGNGIIEYEHIEPEFHNATKHDPAGITLLCPQCHAKKTRKFLSVETVKAAMAKPMALQKGYAKEVFDIGGGRPIIVFAGSIIRNCPVPLLIAGHPLFTIEQPEENGGPFRLSGDFYDSQGKPSLSIVNNEWQAWAGNWDVTVSGGAITIHEDTGRIHLVLRSDPPDTIIVERLNMTYQHWEIIGDAQAFTAKNLRNNWTSTFARCISDNNRGAGFSFG